MENGVKRREWVKTAAIILLAVLLVLTFFSKTIMNASLPEVATQQVSSGAINARIRGSGTVEASEVYNVVIKQTRKVASVLVKTGQEINVGDTLFVLEAEESDEVATAEEALAGAQKEYDSMLITAGNKAAQNNYDLQKAQQEYNDALTIYGQYSTVDATQLSAAITKAKTELTTLTQQSKAASDALTEAEKEKAKYDAEVTALEAEVAKLEEAQAGIDSKYQEMKDATRTFNADQTIYYDDYKTLLDVTNESEPKIIRETNDPTSVVLSVSDVQQPTAAGYTQNDELLWNYLVTRNRSDLADRAGNLSTAYKTITSDLDTLKKLCNEYDQLKRDTNYGDLSQKQSELRQAQLSAERYKTVVDQNTKQSDAAADAVTAKENEIEKLTNASDSAEKVKTAKKALEELVFTQSLGDTSNLDLQSKKEEIEKKQKELDKLRENADELEVKSSVSGTIASINASAGKSIGGEEQPLATINVTDRGFTVKIDVTSEQAKKVKVGDTAELVNFWGGDAAATLDQITNSQSSGSRTLVFTLTGDIQAGQNITLSIGQKSANYDALIPLSGLREDSNGKFVYVLQSKNSPLGSRYIATRVTVQELARDDKSAAVSGISQGDFIITTSNKPVEAGKQVRLADNG